MTDSLKEALERCEKPTGLKGFALGLNLETGAQERYATVVVRQDALCYTVRRGWAWADIFVRRGVAQEERPRHWVHVAVISDYGSFGYCWTHIGEDWRRFLSGLGMHYAMQKFMGAQFRVPMEGYEAKEKARSLVLRDRRERNLEKAEARDLWDGAANADEGSGCAIFLRDWDSLSGGLSYAREYWEYTWDKVNPQAQGFWAEIWPHFIAALAAEDGSQPPVPSDGEVQRSGTTEPNPPEPNNAQS